MAEHKYTVRESTGRNKILAPDGNQIATADTAYDAKLILTALNAHESLVSAATFARNRLLQDSGDQKSIDKLNAALATAEGK